MTEKQTPIDSTYQNMVCPTKEYPEPSVKKFANIAQIVSSISHPKVVTFSHLVRKLKLYLSPADIDRVLDAFRFADEKHLGQIRKSGEPYISHPLCVAEICSEWKLDAQAISAALLHDVVEDQGVSLSELIERFGPTIANMVDGLSKLEKIQFQSWMDGQGENFRKLLIAMSKDIRVILVKLADRLHNMRTLGSMRDDKRHRISRETMEVYVPIAHRLGMNKLYRELQDLAFHHLYPFRYETLAKAVNTSRKDRRPLLEQVHDTVSSAMKKNGLHAELYGREKTLYSIFRKMRNKHLTFDEVFDIYGFRIVVDTIPQCYLALGVLHSIYKPMPGKFEDYIAIPKLNNYQSLHTTLIGPYGSPVEFQIRTHDMHHVAENGIAAHWLYKTGEDLNELQRHSLGWLQSLLDIQQQTGNATEFLEHVKVDLFPDSVYVFTPKSKIIALPKVATALDFAYNIHSEIGDHAVSAKINGMNVPLRTQLQNGDIVEILTEENAHPHPRWLEFVRTGKARSRIRSYLRSVNIADAIQIGKHLLEQSCKTMHIDITSLSKSVLSKLLRETGSKHIEDIYADIGTGKRIAILVARRLSVLIEELHPLTNSDTKTILDESSQNEDPIVIYGSEGLNVTLASCCKPIPGDSIIGELNTTQGLVIHCTECAIAKRLFTKEPQKWINVDWGTNLAGKQFECQFNVQVIEEQGVLARVTGEISNAEVNITAVQIEMQGPFTLFKFTIQVEDRIHLANLMRRVRHVHGVKRIGREQLTT